jgi:hypothetical protein
MKTAPQSTPARIRRYSAARLEKELVFAEGFRTECDPESIRWHEYLKAELARRKAATP